VRRYEPGDGRALAEAVRASYEHLKTFMPWAKLDASDDEADTFCRHACARYLLDEDYTLGIFDVGGNRLLGGTGFHPRGRPRAAGTAEIGMWVRADAAHQGMGTRVLTALLTWGFSDAWSWERLEWHCPARNGASARVAEKARMKLEGRLRADTPTADGRRDTLIYAALRGEWRMTD